MGLYFSSSPIPLSMIVRILICTSSYYHHQFEMLIVSHYLGRWWNNGMRSMPGHVLTETFPYYLLFMRGSHRPSGEADISPLRWRHNERLMSVYSTVYSDADQSKHQSSASLAFVWGIHRDRWIPRTKGQLRGKCFHLMTASCIEGQYYNALILSWSELA